MSVLKPYMLLVHTLYTKYENVMAKLNFQLHYSSLQCHKSIKYADMQIKKHFFLLTMSKPVEMLNIFVETMFFFMILWLIEGSKEQH